MSESMPSPWIRDYLVDIAENHGAQLYNAPVSNKKKKVQIIDLLTYHEDSYVWAWISDKDYRVSVRISKDAAEHYKSANHRSVVDSRFFLIFISDYRPMFSPRPLGPNASGNTTMSHISLDVGYVSQLGIGGHLFGNPRDLEADANMKEWVLGLRQDGGGGNVLKLRKQQVSVQNKKTPPPPPPPPPPPFSKPPTLQYQKPKVSEDVAKPKPTRPQDFNRMYAKRWRKVGVDPWKLLAKPAGGEQPIQDTELGHPPVEPILGAANHLESREPLACPTSPPHTPSPPSSRRQGTPTDWSPSNKGSPVAPDKFDTSAPRNGIQRCDELGVLLITSQAPSDSGGHTTTDTAMALDTCSLQPLTPTPAQRVKRSPICRSSPPTRSSPEPIACSSSLPSQQLPCSSPPPPSSSLPLPSPSLPTRVGIRKNIQRKVPHPGLPILRPNPANQGPVQILVPNSDPSGTGSSQPCSQSQHTSQSQQPQLLLHSPAFPSSLAKEFKPADASTPRNEKLADTSIRASKMSVESSFTHGDVAGPETTSADDKCAIEKADANTGKQRSSSNRPPVPSAPMIEVLEVGTSDPDDEIDELQLTHGTMQTEIDLDARTGNRDAGEGGAGTDHGDNHLSVDKARTRSVLQGSPPKPSLPAAAPVIPHSSPHKQGTDGVPIHRLTQSSECSGAQSSMHSLFSDSLGDQQTASSQVPIPSVHRTDDVVHGKSSPVQVPRHDPEAWKRPSFMARIEDKGKARAVEEPDTPSVKVGKKRRRSAQHESPVPKQAKASEARRETSNRASSQILGHTKTEGTVASDIGKMRSNNRPSTSHTDSTETTVPHPGLRSSESRLASFAVDFERIDLGKGVPIPRLDRENGIKSTLLRTGRIRKFGKKVERAVYILR